MPFVANPRKAVTDLVGKLLAEIASPLSYRSWLTMMPRAANNSSTLRPAQTEWEAEIQPHGMADDLGGNRYPL